MSSIELIPLLEKKLNLKFELSTNPRSLYSDLAPQEAVYSVNDSNEIIALKISGYQLTEIPTEIKNFHYLNILNLSNNKLTDIKTLSSLKLITALNLSKNQISDISNIKRFISLKWLNLNFNLIENIYPISTCHDIHKLYLDKNKITSLNSLSNLPKLRELSAANNQINDISHIYIVKSLLKLDVSQNKIENAEGLYNMEILEDVDLSYNKLKVFPNLSSLKYLVNVNISYNKISEIPDYRINATVNAKGNPFTNIYLFKDPKQAVLNADWLAGKMVTIIEKIGNDKGSMFGIFGKWGRGKSFFWNILKKKLIEKNYDIVEFLAWKYNDNPATWAYLYETIANKFFDKPKSKFSLSSIIYFFKRIWHSFIRKPEQSIWRFFIGFILPIFLLFSLSQNQETMKYLSKFFGDFGYYGLVGTYVVFIYYYFTKVYSLNITNIFKEISVTTFDNVLGLQANIEKELVSIFKRWDKKVILFVDDLDRCNEEKILQIIDSLRIITEVEEISQKLTVIAAIDERILKRVVINKYKNLVEKDNLDMITREYLDKLFVFGMKLASLNNVDKQYIFDNYTSNLQLMFGNVTAFTKKEYNTRSILAENDFGIFKKAIEDIDVTPRQIRNLFNRYLLALEILIDIKQLPEDVDYQIKQLLTFLVVWFSLFTQPDDIKNFVSFEDKNKEQITKKVMNRDFTLNFEDWKTFLHVVEQVIPY